MIDREDIVDRDFDKSLLGYNRVEVKYFKEMIAEEFDKLQDKIKELEETEAKYDEIKGKKAEEIVEEGEIKAAEIISEAREKADNILSDMEEKRARIQNSVNQLELKKNSLINSINNILEQQQELLNLYYQEENDKEG